MERNDGEGGERSAADEPFEADDGWADEGGLLEAEALRYELEPFDEVDEAESETRCDECCCWCCWGTKGDWVRPVGPCCCWFKNDGDASPDGTICVCDGGPGVGVEAFDEPGEGKMPVRSGEGGGSWVGGMRKRGKGRPVLSRPRMEGKRALVKGGRRGGGGLRRRRAGLRRRRRAHRVGGRRQ